MSMVNIKCCDTFSVSKVFFSCKKRENDNEELTFELIESPHKKFEDLIPSSQDYLYLKILKNKKIISVDGNYIKNLLLTKEDLINKKLDSINKCSELFGEYILPLFETSIKNGEAYQFDFKNNNENRIMACSIYPCSIPGAITSVDVVIRNSPSIKNKLRLESFVIERKSSGGVVIPTMH